MKKIIIFFIVLGFILFIQILTYNQVGKDKFYQDFEYSHSNFFNVKSDSLAIETCSHDYSKLVDQARINFDHIIKISDGSSSKQYLDNRNFTLYYFCSEFSSYGRVRVTESVARKNPESPGYTDADWESVYIYIFYKWFKISHKNTGIS